MDTSRRVPPTLILRAFANESSAFQDGDERHTCRVSRRRHARLYNHCIALHKRYHRLTGKHLNQYTLMRHITKLKQREDFEWIGELGSQSAQDVVQRIERGYARFFKERQKGNRRIQPPTFRKVRQYRSFTLKQTGWKLVADNILRIDGRTHKFVLPRSIEGQIKTVTIKRDAVGDFWVCFACEVEAVPILASTGESGGLDFGLKTFLTLDTGEAIECPQFFKANRDAVAHANRALSRKQAGSKRRSKAQQVLARVHRRVAWQRDDWQWTRSVARQLASAYDVLWIEDLNLDGMKRLWGRKVSVLAFYAFTQKHGYLMAAHGKRLCKRDPFFASSKTHFACGFVNDALTLADREWMCPQCGNLVQRDVNAARMLKHGRAMSWSKDHL